VQTLVTDTGCPADLRKLCKLNEVSLIEARNR